VKKVRDDLECYCYDGYNPQFRNRVSYSIQVLRRLDGIHSLRNLKAVFLLDKATVCCDNSQRRISHWHSYANSQVNSIPKFSRFCKKEMRVYSSSSGYFTMLDFTRRPLNLYDNHPVLCTLVPLFCLFLALSSFTSWGDIWNLVLVSFRYIPIHWQ
jgi:hypothetical protein